MVDREEALRDVRIGGVEARVASDIEFRRHATTVVGFLYVEIKLFGRTFLPLVTVARGLETDLAVGRIAHDTPTNVPVMRAEQAGELLPSIVAIS